ncbi:hypothetical protein [Paraburkholderia sediminicola]|uniref:hypothetical protein n=1 Tax=Paraburkholderia sediminicola TaxID=458836 RepID=UPI0038BA2BD0
MKLFAPIVVPRQTRFGAAPEGAVRKPAFRVSRHSLRHRYAGSLQLLLSENALGVLSMPQIRLPARFGCRLHALAELERIATAGGDVEWWAYGVPVFPGQKFVLAIDSLDHIYWVGQHQR